MFVLLAAEAETAVILRRGPTKWWHVTLWDTRRDRFQSGQWFRGQIYPSKCDLSPNGKLLIYFAGKWSARSVAKGYSWTWIAVSRPPYLTALTLWPVGDTWGGRGVFAGNTKVMIAASPKTHPDHPLGPLEVVEDDWGKTVPCWHRGWMVRGDVWRKVQDDVALERALPGTWGWSPDRYGVAYMLSRKDGEPIEVFKAHWADFDQRGRLVAAVGGRILAAKIGPGSGLKWRQLADFSAETPERMEAPVWARTW